MSMSVNGRFNSTQKILVQDIVEDHDLNKRKSTLPKNAYTQVSVLTNLEKY